MITRIMFKAAYGEFPKKSGEF